MTKPLKALERLTREVFLCHGRPAGTRRLHGGAAGCPLVGLPEGNLALAQAVVYLATAPKSNALYEAYSRVQQDVQNTRNEPVPLQIVTPPPSS